MIMRIIPRIVLATLVWSLLAISLGAEVPKIVNYQGRLTDTDGNPVADGDYQITFQIVEHDPMPMGESPLWSSGAQAVTVTDGLFEYNLGSNVPLPAEIFNDDGLESYFLRMHIEGSLLFLDGIALTSTPFAIRSIYSDTADYARAGPGGGASGWIDDGSVVRLESSGDRVGIGTSSPNERLVIGKDMGSMYGDFVVASSPAIDGTSGFTAGYDIDNRGWFSWDNEEKEFQIGVRNNGTNSPSSIYLANGNVGIGNSSPSNRLTIGNSLGSTYGFGDLITIGRTGTSTYSGIMMGEDEDNKANIIWYSNNNEMRLQTESGDTLYSKTLVLKSGHVGIGMTPDTNKVIHLDKAFNLSSTEVRYGVYSKVYNTGDGTAIAGHFHATGPNAVGINASAGESGGSYARAGSFVSLSGDGIYASGTNYAANFGNDVNISGTISKTGGSFKIDHPLDPENKFLQHSFVESPDMMNVYNGNVVTDNNGEAIVNLPDYFEALNKDFRYQLTVIGEFAQAIIGKKINNGRFIIRTDKPNVEVSWQVTGIRQDPWANDHRIQVEVEKAVEERGLYIAPESYGFDEDKCIDYKLHRSIGIDSESD